MPLETATFIHQLNAANPLGSDPVAAGDDHLRMIKSTIKSTFPNITGPITVSQSDINDKVPNAVQKDGSVAMTGELTLAGNPTTNLGAAPKQYVDTASGNLTAAVALKADKATLISAGAGLTGGGDLSANRTLAIATTGVTPGVYGSAFSVPVLTLNDKGQVTTATSASLQGLGYGGETWQNLTGSRAAGVTYTNTTGRPIAVIMQVGAQTNGIYIYLNNELVIRHWYDVNGGAGQIGYSSGMIIVPNNATYMATNGPLRGWWELR